MHTTIIYNGKILPIMDTGIKPINAGLLHGWGVFTTLAIHNHQPFLLNEHWQRLQEHAHTVGINNCWTYEDTYNGLLKLIAANGVRDGRARITLVAEKSPFWHIDNSYSGVELLVFTATLPQFNQPAKLTSSTYRINSHSPIAGIKTIANLEPLLILQQAKAGGVDEVLLLNENDEVCEATNANIFWLRNEMLYTPSLATGCLAGITRQQVIAIAHEFDIKTMEGAFSIDHILASTEVFLTSSTRPLTQVSSINSHLFALSANSLCQKLYHAYMEKVKNHTQ